MNRPQYPRLVAFLGLLATAVAVSLPATRVSVRAQQPAQPLESLLSEADPTRVGALATAFEQNLPYVPGELLVEFRPGLSTAQQASALSALGIDFSQSRSVWIKDTLHVTGLPADDAERWAAILRDQPEVAIAQPNYIRRLQATPNDPGYPRQWNMDDIQMPVAWNINKSAGQGVTVAVLDTGLTTFDGTYSLRLPIPTSPVSFGSFSVPFLKAQDFDFTRVLPGAEFTPTGRWFLPSGQQVLFDAEGHGTHVAGTITQQTNNGFGFAGIANGVTLMPVKVCFSFLDVVMAWGRDLRLPPVPFGGCTDDAVISGIYYAVDRGAKVLNLSVGGPSPGPLQRTALNYAAAKGTFVAIASGNNALEGNPVIYPAAYAAGIPGVVAVGATTKTRTRALYSSYGSYVELVAPGGEAGPGGQGCASDSEIVSQVGPDVDTYPPRFDQYKVLAACGTSMASPHVAGAAALLYSQGVKDPAGIEAALERFAVHLGTTPGRSDEFGYGLIDLRATLLGDGFAK